MNRHILVGVMADMIRGAFKDVLAARLLILIMAATPFITVVMFNIILPTGCSGYRLFSHKE